MSNVTVRGQGQDKTVLNYAGQQGGGESFLVTSNNVTLEDFAVVDPAVTALNSSSVTV